jgi:hypothetical protein
MSGRNRRTVRWSDSAKNISEANVGPVFSPVDTAEKREIEGADGKQREGLSGRKIS